VRRNPFWRACSVVALLLLAGRHSPLAAQEQPAQIAADGFIVVHWPGHERLAEHILNVAPTAAGLPALPRDLFGGGAPVRIYIAPTPELFHELAGGYVPDWGAGVAIPDSGRIVLPVYPGTARDARALTAVLRHELAHVALHRYLAPARPPRWFDEGFARWAAGEWDWASAWKLRVAFALHRAPPLDSISLSWPVATSDAQVAYLLSTTAIVYLVRRSGERGLSLMLDRWRQGATLEEAMRATYGLTLAQFEEHWRASVRREYGWALALSYSLVFWSAGALLMLVLYRSRRRRDEARLARLRAQEIPDDPAYWIPPPSDLASDHDELRQAPPG